MPTMMKQKERNGDPEQATKKSENSLRQLPADVLLRARSTLFSLGGALKSRPVDGHHSKQKQKQSTLENLIKGKPKSRAERLKTSKSEPEFQQERKQQRKSRTPTREEKDYRRSRPMSVGPTPRRSLDYDDDKFRCGSYQDDFDYPRRYDSVECMEYLHPRLVLPVQSDSLGGSDSLDGSERPRKKLSFREPEIDSGHAGTNHGRNLKHMGVNSLTRNNRYSVPPDKDSYDNNTDSDLESQAMRIVRTVGQAFEVCHKLSTNGSDPAASSSNTEEPAPSLSEAHSEPPKKEAVSESSGWEAAGSSSAGEASTSAVVEKFEKPAVRPQKLELLPPPPRKENRRSPQRNIPTPTFPSLPECVTKVEPLPAPSSADGAGSSLSSSTPLSAQHELQLLKERLEQQSQQTRAAVAQLLLLRDQLAAEQAARCEAQARTHQLLVHNKELLDHITALVAHLQERERGSRHTPISVQQLTLVPQATPATPQGTPVSILSSHIPNDNAGILELLAQTSQMKASASIQNLQNNNLSTFTGSPIESTSVNGPTNAFPQNNNITTEQLITQFQNLSTQPQSNALNCNQQFFQNCNAFPNIPPLINHYNNLDLERMIQQNQVFTRSNMNLQQIGSMHSPQSPNSSISHSSLFSPSPAATSKDSTPDGVSSDEGTAFIMPLSHSTTLTTTDTDGRVRLIVPVSPSGSTSDFGEAYLNNNNEPSKQGKVSEVTLNITDESGNTRRALPAAPPITRTTSEKVPNRSEMMATMRAQWTRHTTK